MNLLHGGAIAAVNEGRADLLRSELLVLGVKLPRCTVKGKRSKKMRMEWSQRVEGEGAMKSERDDVCKGNGEPRARDEPETEIETATKQREMETRDRQDVAQCTAMSMQM